MKKLQNLYELKNNTVLLIERYREDHDWEIGYQKFYQFLINDLYNFFIDLKNKYAKNDIYQINYLYKRSFNIPRDAFLEPFIMEFIDSYELASISFDPKNNKNGVNFLTIEFQDNSIEYAFTCLYNEIQKLEYYMKSSEEMNKELEEFNSYVKKLKS